MIRCITVGLLSLALIAFSTSAGQEPPDKPEPPPVLKKKVRPEQPGPDKEKPAESKPKEGAKDKDEAKPKDKTDPGPDPQKEAQEILDRIAKNLQAAEERLKAKDTGDGTQQVQRDIIKDLDALIEQNQKQLQQPPNQDQQAGAGMGGSKQKSSSRSSRASRGPKSGNQQAGNQQKNQGDASAQGNQGQQNQNPQGQGGDQPGTGGMSAAGIHKLADLYKDVWGHLPETLRQEMDAYQKEGYLTKYRELLKQYYATLAEKARRQAEGER